MEGALEEKEDSGLGLEWGEEWVQTLEEGEWEGEWG